MREKGGGRERVCPILCGGERERECVCVCVCVPFSDWLCAVVNSVCSSELTVLFSDWLCLVVISMSLSLIGCVWL